MKKIIMIIMAVALYALPAMAQNNIVMQPTSTMPGSGSAYSPHVTDVGASSPASSYSAAKAPNGPRRGFDTGGDTKPGPSPIGDAVLPLALMALTFAGVIYFRKRKARV